MFKRRPVLAGNSVATTPLERFYLRQSISESMVIRVTVRLDGDLPTDRIREAWLAIAAQTLRLSSRMVGRGRQQVWQQDHAGITETFVATSDPTEVDRRQDNVDPRDGFGGNLVVVRPDSSSQHVELNFLFHHSVCDGLGASKIIGQVCKQIGQSFRDRSSLLRRPPSKRSDAPNELDSQKEGIADSVAPPMPDLRNLWTTVRGHNANLRWHTRPMPQANEVESFERRVKWSAAVSRQLRTHLKSQPIRFNDFWIAIMLHVLDDVVEPAPGRHLSVLNPVDLRQWKDRGATCNHMGFACVRRPAGGLGTQQQTMQDVSSQMQMVRHYGTGQEMLQGMSIIERVPLGYRMLDQLGTFVPTVTVSCLGNLKYGKRLGVERMINPDGGDPIYYLGNAKVNDLEISSPLAPGSPLTITVWDTSDGLSVYFNCVRDAEFEKRAAAIANSLIRRFDQLMQAVQ